MFAFAFKLLSFLVEIPAIINHVREFAAGVSYWYVQTQTKETARLIADAAAFAARAESEEDRIKANAMWRDALSRPRYRV